MNRRAERLDGNRLAEALKPKGVICLTKNCGWCGNVIEGQPVRAYEKRDKSSIELAKEPFEGCKPIVLCRRCATS